MGKSFSQNKLDRLFLIMGDNLYISALRRGISLSIPFFLVGSMTLVGLNIPILGYGDFIKEIFDGCLYKVLMNIYNSTMGILSLVLITTVSASFGQLVTSNYSGLYPITSLVCYMAFVLPKNIKEAFVVLSPDWMFTAMFVSLSCCSLLRVLINYSKKWRDQHYQEGIDSDFQNVMVSLAPVAGCILFFILLKSIMFLLFDSNEIHNIGSVIFVSLFEKIGTGFAGALVFVFLCHILWFFGMHGSNMMHMVAVGMFEAGMEKNLAMIEAGAIPTELYTKTFFDCFVLMGGSGATLCLLMALAIGSKKRSNMKKLFEFSIVPGVFNINEIVLFGLPVVFNPIMLIPFVIVPMVLLCISAGAMVLGLVPYCAQSVAWTTPIFFSGYLSTGSWAGVLLQLLNLLLGALIYLPFVRKSEKYCVNMLKQNVDKLKNVIIEREETGNTASLYSSSYRHLSEVIKMLTADLYHCLNNHKISLYYQPQFKSDGTLYGIEALLRWKHASLGFLYPPMVIELAREEGILQKMGYQIIDTVSCVLERISEEVNYPIHLAVNISPEQLEDPEFCENVENILKQYNFHECILCFEITEQIALSSTPFIQETINQLRDMGIEFHMDDFGMGHSSLMYLQKNEFSTVKLDGSLIQDILTNNRVREIIGGIQQISQSLNVDLIAEYVETEEQKNVLQDLGCQIYQGYLYSPAVPLNELEVLLRKYDVIQNISLEELKVQELYL